MKFKTLDIVLIGLLILVLGIHITSFFTKTIPRKEYQSQNIEIITGTKDQLINTDPPSKGSIKIYLLLQDENSSCTELYSIKENIDGKIIMRLGYINQDNE